MALNLPAPLYYTLADLATEWKCHPDRIRTYAASGLLALSGVDVDGAMVPAIAHEEKARFEGEAMGRERRLDTRERKTLLNIIGALAFIAYRDDVKAPYALTRQIEEEAATLGLPLEMGDDSLANKLKDSFALMREAGCIHFDPSPE